MENTKYGKRREGQWTPTRAKAQDARANPNSWETHLVRKKWDIELLRALSLRIIMMILSTGLAHHHNSKNNSYGTHKCTYNIVCAGLCMYTRVHLLTYKRCCNITSVRS